jgi:microcystin-dependent protein
MTETYQHYSETDADTREYAQANMAQHFQTVHGDLDGGVVYGKLNGLAVLQHSTGDRSVDVATGWGWVKGQMVINTALYNIAIDTNTSGSSRYDRIVLHNEISSGTDDITIIVLKGTPGGAPPALTQTATVWEISLASFCLVNGYTQILTAGIDDERTFVTIPRVDASRLVMDADKDMGGELVSDSGAPTGAGDALTKGFIDGIATTYYPLPSGAVVPFGNTTIPDGFLACDGAAVSRTTYASLFATVGTGYGVGNGTTTFNVPDLRSRVIMGHSGSGDYTYLGATGGAATVTISTATMPAHTHAITMCGGSLQGGHYAPTAATIGTPGTAASGSYGGGTAHDNMPPNILLKWGIKT